MSALDVVALFMLCEYLLAGGAVPARPKTQRILLIGIVLIVFAKSVVWGLDAFGFRLSVIG